MTQTATGTSMRLDGVEAGREAARKAADGLGTTDARLVLVFAGPGYEHGDVLAGVDTVFDGSPVSGSSTEGVITREGSCEDIHTVAVMALAGAPFDVETVLVDGVSEGAGVCAGAIVDQLSEAAVADGGLLLVFPPGLTSNTSELLEELDERLPDSVTIAGGAAGQALTSGEANVEPTTQYRGTTAITDGVAGVLLAGNLEVETSVSHGCVPIGIERTVTAAEGPIVEEIDGTPAWEVLREYLPESGRTPESVDLVHLSVGVKLPPALAEIYESPYIIRSPSVVDTDRGTVFFPGVLPEGTEISVVLRDPDRVGSCARRAARSLSERRGDEPAFVLQFDCAGRGRFLFGEEVTAKAIRPVQQAFGDDVTWFGCHPFGEIAPVRDQTMYHNHTVALCAVYPGTRRQ